MPSFLHGSASGHSNRRFESWIHLGGLECNEWPTRLQHSQTLPASHPPCLPTIPVPRFPPVPLRTDRRPRNCPLSPISSILRHGSLLDPSICDGILVGSHVVQARVAITEEFPATPGPRRGSELYREETEPRAGDVALDPMIQRSQNSTTECSSPAPPLTLSTSFIPSPPPLDTTHFFRRSCRRQERRRLRLLHRTRAGRIFSRQHPYCLTSRSAALSSRESRPSAMPSNSGAPDQSSDFPSPGRRESYTRPGLWSERSLARRIPSLFSFDCK